MTRKEYDVLERYMVDSMEDSAHDCEHIYRVLYNALEIAESAANANYDVLIAACLLHDIGRKEQFADPTLCHAAVGSEKAYRFLVSNGYSAEFALQVRHCIATHRFRKAMPPQTIEAKILFDADKLDVTGAIGIARTLQYKADQKEPLYHRMPDGGISDGSEDLGSSFFREYKFKLEKLYDRFYTEKGAFLAQQRRNIADAFYKALYQEVNHGYLSGQKILETYAKETEQ